MPFQNQAHKQNLSELTVISFTLKVYNNYKNTQIVSMCFNNSNYTDKYYIHYLHGDISSSLGNKCEGGCLLGFYTL
jgi:hypothetical protein